MQGYYIDAGLNKGVFVRHKHTQKDRQAHPTVILPDPVKQVLAKTLV